MFRSILIACISLMLAKTSFAQTATAAYNEGIKQKQAKNYEAAITAFKKAISLNASYKEACYEAGWCLNEQEKYEDALYYLKKADRLWPDQAKIKFELGYASEKTDKPDDAIDYYKTCISLYEDYTLAYKALGNVYFKQQNYKKALDFYQTYTEKEPKIKSAEFYYRKGYCENDLEKYEDAVTSLNKSIALDDAYANARTELGYSLYALGRYSEAIEQLNKSVSLNKQQLPVYYKGLCYVAMKRKSAAQEVYNDLKEMDSDYADKLKKKIDEM